MTLQTTIEKAMNRVTQEIIATNEENSDIQRRIEILKSSIDKIVSLSPAEIIMRDNVRHTVDTNSSDFKNLCESIHKYGLLENIVAELKISDDGKKYELVCISGHRRLTALKMLGMTAKIPCLIKQYKPDDRIGVALSENLNREDLSYLDIADGYSKLKHHGWSDDDLARHFERNKKTIALYLRLAELPDDIKNLIRENQEKLSLATIFQQVLAKNKTPGDIRKAINRKITTEKPIAKKSKNETIKEKLDEFFILEETQEDMKQTIISAFQYAGVLK